MAAPANSPVRQFLEDLASGLPWEQVMRRNEVAAGHKIVVPGDVPWLPKAAGQAISSCLWTAPK